MSDVTTIVPARGNGTLDREYSSGTVGNVAPAQLHCSGWHSLNAIGTGALADKFASAAGHDHPNEERADGRNLALLFARVRGRAEFSGAAPSGPNADAIGV
jgi:hypothetical protein